MRFSPTRRSFPSCSFLLAAVASLNLVFPLHVVAETPVARPAAPAPSVVDVALGANGQLAGQVVDAAGTLQANEEVVVVSAAGQVVGRTKSDGEGRFAVTNLRGGVYQVATARGVQVCRCWAAQAAPPAAQQQVLLVSDASLQRGQQGLGKFFTHPVLLGLIIAAAITIPIVIHNNKDDAS